jgi:short-subunit dehydrogenase
LALKVVITGASSGLGRALARHYASGGAQLGLFARRAGVLSEVASGLQGNPALYTADVRDREALEDGAADFVGRFGAPDIVIANAGVSGGTLTERAEDMDTIRAIFDTNVLGMAQTFQPFIGPMRENGSGALAGISSVAGYRGLPGAGAYSGSKAAAIAYLESLRVELRGSGLHVVTVCPGYVATPMTARNPYRMPFMLEADDAARRIGRIIASGRSFAVIPWQMAIVARLLRILPNAIYDRVFAKAPRKPRGL